MEPLLELTTLRGREVEPCLDELAQLRIQVFREWPYLYDGSVEYERNYLAAQDDRTNTLTFWPKSL